MSETRRATLFISYSHAATEHMLLFRKHLEGVLFGKALVWSDQAIRRGARWENSLRARLKHADAALILVTPDYLASTWCRRELSIIVAEQKAGRLRKLFWIQVEASGWRGTELAAFQAWGFNTEEALVAIGDANTRLRAVVRVCEEIADEMDTVGSQLDNDLTFVRNVVMDQAVERGLVVDSPLSGGQGTFATVCRGRQGTEDVAIKVLRAWQIRQLSELFGQLLRERKTLTNQGFIRVLDHFSVDTELERFIVVVEEFMVNAERLDKSLQAKRFSVHEVALVLRRAAEALKHFHDLREKTSRAYGLLTPRHVYYDSREQKLLLPAVGISNFLWANAGWERSATWQSDQPNLAAYVAPEEVAMAPPTHLTDQYMLGQLAFEMLEGALPFDVGGRWDMQKKEAFWESPEATARGEWVETHRAFAKIIFRMLRKDPAQRWESFDELNRRLDNLEDENRALAKRTFEGLPGIRLRDNPGFFQSFYREFFDRSPESKAKFPEPEEQPKKLMDSMIAVLNFRASNEPTALREVVNKHQRLGITPEEIDDFRDAFLDTLRKKLPRSMPSTRKEAILNAWRELFSPVVEYFKDELPRPEPATSAPTPPRARAAGRRPRGRVRGHTAPPRSTRDRLRGR